MLDIRKVLFLTGFCVAAKACCDKGFLSGPAPICDWDIIRKIKQLNTTVEPTNKKETYKCIRSTYSVVYNGIKCWTWNFTEEGANYEVNGVTYFVPIKTECRTMYFPKGIVYQIRTTEDAFLCYACSTNSGLKGPHAASLSVTKNAKPDEVEEMIALAAELGLTMCKTYNCDYDDDRC